MNSIPNMIAVVESYIHHRTEKEVKISTNNINLMLLIEAYQYAVQWFNENNGKIELTH